MGVEGLVAPEIPLSFDGFFLDQNERLYRALYFVTGDPRWSPDGRKLAFLFCCRKIAYYPAPNAGIGAVQQAYALRLFLVEMGGPVNGLPRDTGATVVGDSSGVSWHPSSTALLVDRWS